MMSQHYLEAIHSVNADSLRSFIIVDSGHHRDEILHFRTDNSHRGSGWSTVTNSWLGNCRLLDWTAMCSGI